MACWLGRFQSAACEDPPFPNTALDWTQVFRVRGQRNLQGSVFLGPKCVLRFDGGRLACVRDLPLDSVVCI